MAGVAAKVGQWLMSTYYGITCAVPLAFGVLTRGPGVLSVKKRPARPRVLDNPDLGTHHYAHLKDITLHYVANGPEDAPLMLMVHGYPEFWYSFRHQLKEFSDKYRVVALDFRGFGESDKPIDVKDYTMDKFIADIEKVIKYLGYSSCILVAHDWGGVVSYLFAAKHTVMVDKLVILNALHPRAWMQLIKTYPEQRKKSWYVLMYQWRMLPEMYMRAWDLYRFDQWFRGDEGGAKPGAITDEDMEAYKYTFQHYDDMTSAINFYRAVIQYPSKDRSFQNTITSPTLIIFGTADLGLSTEGAEMSKNLCANATLKHITGGSHWIQQEEPELVHTYMREFLDGSGIASQS